MPFFKTSFSLPFEDQNLRVRLEFSRRGLRDPGAEIRLWLVGEFPINALGVKSLRQNNTPPIIRQVGDKTRFSRLYMSKDMGKTWKLFGEAYDQSHLCYVLPTTFGPQLITPEILAKFAEKMREKAAKKAAKLTAEASRF